jgi:arylsulfatase A-like enzyme
MYEEAIRVPLLIKPPGWATTDGESHRSQLTSHVDLPATICDYLGIDWPAGDGMSLRPVVERSDSPTRDMVFSEFNGNAGRGCFQRAAITASHKYIHNEGDHAELYDLENDPLECENLIGKPEIAPTQQRLHQALGEWMRTSGDFLDIDQSESSPC